MAVYRLQHVHGLLSAEGLREVGMIGPPHKAYIYHLLLDAQALAATIAKSAEHKEH